MKMQEGSVQKPVMVLGLALLVISIIAAYLWQQLRDQNAQNEQLSARLTALEPAVPAAAARVPQPQAVSAPGEALPAAVPVPAPTTQSQQRASDAKSLAALSRQMMETPEGREFRLVMRRQSLAREYPDVQKALNLTPEQVDKLFDVLARREVDEQSMPMSIRERGPADPAAREEMARSMAEKNKAYRAELAAALGSSYDKWDEYQLAAKQRQREGWERVAADQMRVAISSGNNSMSDAQFQAFNTAVKAEQERIDRTLRSPQQQMQSMPENNRKLIEVASAHLNPEQLAAYRRHLEQQTEMMREAISTLGEDE
jgi:hypothetical protein